MVEIEEKQDEVQGKLERKREYHKGTNTATAELKSALERARRGR